ncbi:hypothetical protein OG225_12000 [Nocardia sp. NBC_01377]|uniref:hypothetical protein n=1 Tax=Nocardia sp. NBC_01377 TaxID=2903595 RepID=UPI00324E02BD
MRLTGTGKERVADTLRDRGAEFHARTRDGPLADLREFIRLLRQLTAADIEQ